MLFLKKSRQPEKIEPPDRIGEKLGDQKSPGLSESQEGGPAYFRRGLILPAPNICQLLRRTMRMLLRRSVDGHPQNQPEEAGGSRDQKRRSPAPVNRDPGDNQRRQNRTHVAARIEDSGSQRALFLGKPFG